MAPHLLLEVVSCAVSLGASVFVGNIYRKTLIHNKVKRCTAHYEYERHVPGGVFTLSRVESDIIQCPEASDPRCEGGLCSRHCRDKNRCNGYCLKAREEALKNMKEL